MERLPANDPKNPPKSGASKGNSTTPLESLSFSFRILHLNDSVGQTAGSSLGNGGAAASPSSTPNFRASMGSTHHLESLSIRNRHVNNGGGSSMSEGGVALPSSIRIPDTVAEFYQNHESGFRRPEIVPPPPHLQSYLRKDSPQSRRSSYARNPAGAAVGNPPLLTDGFSTSVNYYPMDGNNNITADNVPQYGYNNREIMNSNYGFPTPQATVGFNGFNNNAFQKTDALSNQPVIVRVAMTPEGSMHLQNLLSKGDPIITNKIFMEVIHSIFTLMTNKHGHHLFMKLIQSCDENQLQMITEYINLDCEGFIKASLDRYGSPSIQKLIKILKRSPLISLIVDALYYGFYVIMISLTGYNVIMKCLEIHSHRTNEKLYRAAVANCIALATNEQGCISLNKLITNIQGSFRGEILDVIAQNAVYLSQDPSGNFVVQRVLDLQHPVITEKICTMLKGHYAKISMQKGGSYVVEKCLKSGKKDLVVEDLLQSNQFSEVAKDQFGNFVIQTALKETKRGWIHLHEMLLMKLQGHPDVLQRRFGRNILALIDSLRDN